MQDRNKILGIKSWAADDQPRHKLKLNGAGTLSDSELLALLIGSGSVEESAVDLCKRILQKVDHDLDQLARLDLKDLMAFKGIGEAKAITISAALELGRRRLMLHRNDKVKITSSQIAFECVAPLLQDKIHEEFWVLYLNRSNQLIDRVCISQGGVAGTVVDAKLIFKNGLQALASGIILVHNHPSGQLKPSQLDLDITKKLKQGAALLDMKIHDHLIVGGRQYLSFADEGLL